VIDEPGNISSTDESVIDEPGNISSTDESATEERRTFHQLMKARQKSGERFIN